jgi:hypothetical protein
VTEQSEPTAAQPGESLPQRKKPEPLPQRESSLPQRGGQAHEPAPQRGPSVFEPLHRRSEPLPERSGPAVEPLRAEPLPQRADPLPQRADPLPQRGDPLPQRGQQPSGADPLPRRTTRTRPAGRHRSPHRLSVAPEAPALVLAVPGTAENDPDSIGPEIAAIAELSCPGVDIRVGYLDGSTQALAEVLDAGTESDGHDQFPSVIVPLLVSPSPRFDDAIQRIAAQPTVPAVVAAHLGPHPLVAEALHSRLAEAGLARYARSTGLSISADGRGVVVLADVGAEAASEASIVAVLLASRLSVPVMPASLGDPASIADAVTRLSDSGASRPALAPCLIGPGTTVAVFDDLSAALGAPSAAPLGAHQAIGQLVAIRYGAALATLSLAG